MSMRPLLAATLALCLAPAGTAAGLEIAPRELVVSAGVFDVQGRGASEEAGLELRFASFELPLGRLRLEVEPMAGGMANDGGGYYGYLGFGLPWRPARRWELRPFTGVGVYSAGDGRDLGGPIEFRSGLEVSWRPGERSRLGLTLYHLSNGVIYDLNPGSESLVAVYGWRFGG